MAEGPKFAESLVLPWAIFCPLWLLMAAALAWGRTSLSRAEIARAMAWTLAASVVLAFPAAWAIYAYCAGFNPSPTVSRAQTGVRFAAGLFPVYSALVAWVAFEPVHRGAVLRGAPARPLWIRIPAQLAIAIAVFLGLAVLGTGCFLAAGPKALG